MQSYGNSEWEKSERSHREKFGWDLENWVASGSTTARDIDQELVGIIF